MDSVQSNTREINHELLAKSMHKLESSIDKLGNFLIKLYSGDSAKKEKENEDSSIETAESFLKVINSAPDKINKLAARIGEITNSLEGTIYYRGNSKACPESNNG